jgi:hypothetical protein
LEHALPVGLGLGLILAVEPGEVVPERAPHGQGLGSRVTGEGGIAGEQVGQDVEDAPAVEEQVVEGPEHLYFGVGQPRDDQTLQRRRSQIQTLGAVGVEQAGQFGLSGRFR